MIFICYLFIFENYDDRFVKLCMVKTENYAITKKQFLKN